MSNPYDSVSVGASYNQNPPSDDGSQTSGNQLEWSKHKDKLADPLKTAIESINSNASAAHALHLGTTFELKTMDYQIAPGDRGKFFSVTGTTTVTLPAVADAGVGFPVIVKNDGAGLITVSSTASELIDGVPDIELDPTEWAILTTDGTTWTAGIWQITPAFVDPAQRKVKTANTAKVTDTTLADDPHLSVELVSGEYYSVELYLDVEVTGGSTPDFTFTWTIPAGSTGHFMYMDVDEAGSVLERDLVLDWTTTTQIDLTQNTDEGVHITGTILAGDDGTFALQWAQDVSSGNTITLKALSRMTVTKIQ